jgi:hypothetical protein
MGIELIALLGGGLLVAGAGVWLIKFKHAAQQQPLNDRLSVYCHRG